jgi:hypothetical protein
MQMLEEWLADDSPTPQVFRDLVTGQCELVSRGEFEERERICGACQIIAREKMRGNGVHWKAEFASEESLSSGMEKGNEEFLKSRNLEWAEGCSEGSSGRKVEEAGKKWYLKNGYEVCKG